VNILWLNYIIHDTRKMADHRDVFLGGTCGDSKWRDTLIAKLNGVTYFNPVKPPGTWTREDEELENKYKKTCEYMLFIITPEMQGYYSIAEVVESSFKKPGRTIFCALDTDNEKSFSDVQNKSLRATERLLQRNKAIVKRSLDEVANFLNQKHKSGKSCIIC